jgi:hypothetical protein
MSDIQKVVAMGPYVKTYERKIRATDIRYNSTTIIPAEAQLEKVGFGVGDWVKINLSRFVRPKNYKSLKDGSQFDETKLEYYIPLVEFGGEEYLEIDQGDVEYWWDESVFDTKTKSSGKPGGESV